MLTWLLEGNIQSVFEVARDGCYNVAMVHRSIQSVLEVDSNGCWNVASEASSKLLEMDVTT